MLWWAEKLLCWLDLLWVWRMIPLTPLTIDLTSGEVDVLGCPGTGRGHYLHCIVEKKVMKRMTQQPMALPVLSWGRCKLKLKHHCFSKDHTTCCVQVQMSCLPTTGCIWTRCFGHPLEMGKWAGRRVDAQVSNWWTVEPGIYFYHFHVISNLRNSRTGASKLC